MAIEIAGWGGTVLILLAYALLSAGRLQARSVAYQLLNILGALGMAVNGYAHGALPSVFNNAVWMAIGGVAMVRIARHRRPPAAIERP